MCGRYILTQKIERIAERFNVKIPEKIDYKPSYNISPGDFTPVITNKLPEEIQIFRFGLTPFWSKKSLYLINARAEGDRNKENSSAYRGSKDIINKPAFRKPIRTQRCLIPADAFIEGTTEEGLKKPFVVYLRNKNRPFAFAGIWDQWIDTTNENTIYSFSIITTTANTLIQKIPHHRSPVILNPADEKRWLSEKTPLSEITAMLKPYDATQMNAYPIDKAISHPKAEGRQLITPAGEPVEQDEAFHVAEHIKKSGFGRRKIR